MDETEDEEHDEDTFVLACDDEADIFDNLSRKHNEQIPGDYMEILLVEQRSSVNAKASAPIGGSAQPVRKEVKDPLLNNQNAYADSGRSSHSSYSGSKPKAHIGSYANAVNEAHGSMLSPSPALVLDDSCLVERDLSRHVMGKVKDFSAIPNLSTIFSDEGFYGTKLTYMGGLWVMIELDKVDTKETLKNHSGVKSWFLDIKDAVEDFVSEDRIVWMDIEGVPLKAWSRETFIKIGKKWGETLDLEDNTATSFGRKRICIRTNHATSIFESFKIIVKGRVYMVRAKELFTWNPIFMIHKEKDYNSDVESVIEPINNNDNEEDLDDDYASDVNGVPETVFGTNSSSNIQGNGPVAVQQSDDPFGLYDLMNKKKTREISEPSPSLTHPPGFTPEFLEKQNAVEDKNSLEFLNAKVMTSSQEIPTVDHNDQTSQKETNCGGSVLGVMEDVIRMNALSINIQGLGHKTKKEWVKALTYKHKLNFLAIQETKMNRISHMDVRFMWGNTNYDFVCSDSLGNSGGILCIWEATIFKKENVTISDNFIAIYGTWLSNNAKILFVVVYAPQQASSKTILWDYFSTLLRRWNGEAIIMGDFNEVRSREERRGSCFNPYSARRFDSFILTSGLVDIKLEGYTFTWSHPSATKMSKLDRFLVSEGIFNLFPYMTAICLDRHISDHRPILLREVNVDFGPTPFRFYNSWFNIVGFDEMIQASWHSFSHSDRNAMVRFKKKLQDLKSIIRRWVKDKRALSMGTKRDIINELGAIDKELDSGLVSDTISLRRLELKHKLLNINDMESKEYIQKSKVTWAIEGDENSKFFHGIINKKRSQLAIRGIFVDGSWCTDPGKVKEAFVNHFETRFKEPVKHRFKINFQFPKKLLQYQVEDLEKSVSRDEIRLAVWNCGSNKSPGPDGYSFDFFKKYWDLIGSDLCEAVEYFFDKGSFPKGCNSSFIALIPKVLDAKFVNDFRPISLIGCVYKIVTKVLANRLKEVISDIVSDTQSAFVSGRQILDGP
ncbi:RNA-directed DNA polymerase, eukaryota, partial [Tanacetum coccineum]